MTSSIPGELPYHEEEYRQRMDNQEFQDSDSEYVMTSFLGGDNKWIGSLMQIPSWRLVSSDVEVD